MFKKARRYGSVESGALGLRLVDTRRRVWFFQLGSFVLLFDRGTAQSVANPKSWFWGK